MQNSKEISKVTDLQTQYNDIMKKIKENDHLVKLNAHPNLKGLLKNEFYYKYDADCTRKKSNWSKSKPEYKFDHPEFSEDQLQKDIHTHSPKLESLLQRIADLDKRDMKTDGRMYKHFIFSDIKSGLYGAKLIAGALLAKGMHLGYSAELTGHKSKSYSKIVLDDDATLMKTKFNNFYLLSSVSVYDQPISVAMKKSILQKFNQRPDNIYGELARIIVMDSGYKEGIDLFDIKYVHIYEPQTTMADQKQVIGRGTRTCGQKGLAFHPTKGWPLYVYIYDVSIPAELKSQMLGSSTLFDLYMKAMNIDFRLFTFQQDLEKNTVYGSVDYELNREIHNFAIEPDQEDMMFGGAHKKFVMRPALPTIQEKSNPVLDVIAAIPAQESMTFNENREFVRRYFKDFAWKDVKMQNNCAEKQSGGATLLNYTPTQGFVQSYFTPQNPVKGMLLWHSVGTGKTCSAIASASASFERAGYTILWVTRTTLKNDIWKNMFDQVCNENIRDKIANGEHIPDEQSKRMRLLSKSWSIRPMSYKQFSNLVSKQNNFYASLVKKNGEADPLQKTLLIIDEAHKLYGGEDLSSIERPDMKALTDALQNSYMVSGANSVRLLLMTATPITGNPMEIIKLINLTKPIAHHMPEEFAGFSDKYLNDEGLFTAKGADQYLDDIAGHVSYLNREKDARQFSQPIVKFVNTPLVDDINEVARLDQRLFREQQLAQLTQLQKQVEENASKIDSELKGANSARFGFLKEECEEYEGKQKRACEKIVRSHIKEIVAEVKAGAQEIQKTIKELKATILEKKKYRAETLASIKEDISSETDAKRKELEQSMYYAVLRKCGKKITTNKELQEVVKTFPEVQEIDADLAIIDANIDKLNQELEINIKAHQNRLKEIKGIMKTNITEEEKALLRTLLKERTKSGKIDLQIAKNNASRVQKQLDKEKRMTMKLRKRVIIKVKKQINDTMKTRERNEKEMAKVKKQEEKLLQKQGVYVKEFQNVILKSILEKHEKPIYDEIVKAVSVIEEAEEMKSRQKADKAEKKSEKKAHNATKKQQKSLEAEHRKTVKNQKALAKEAEKQAKEAEKQAKETEKKAKEAAKEAEKQAKERAKEMERQAKEAEKQAKEAEKQSKERAKEMERQAKEAEKQAKEKERAEKEAKKLAEKQAKESMKAEKAHMVATRKLQVEQKKLNKTMKNPPV